MQDKTHIIFWYAFLVACLLGAAFLYPRAQETNKRRQDAVIPYGYDDTVASGRERAKMDVHHGVPKWGVRGLPARNFVASLREAGVSPLFFGCVLSEYGEDFWHGYNKYVFDKMNLKNLVVEPFFWGKSSPLLKRTV
jgi:hypothetical protein